MRTTLRRFGAALATFALANATATCTARAAQTTRELPSPKFAYSEPGISADGKEIAFVSGGDIWSVPAGGGEAQLLLSNGYTSRRPLYSPDGEHLAFVSNRSGHNDLYVLDFGSGNVRRISYDRGFSELDGWSRDSSQLYFTSAGSSIAFTGQVFRVSERGGTPMPLVAEPYVESSQGVPSPDRATIAYVTGGFPAQWWRHGHSHIDESRIALYKPAGGDYRALTPGGAVEHWPLWSADGQRLYYVSDRSGTLNLTSLDLVPNAAPHILTHFTDDRVLWPSIANDGTIAFERDFGIWTYDARGGAHEVPIHLRGGASQPAQQHATQTLGFSGLSLSPDGKKVAFIARGRIFAASAREGGDAFAVTSEAASTGFLTWAPDSAHLAYVSDVHGSDDLYLYDFRSGTTTALTRDGSNYLPVFAPGGKSLAYLHARHDVRVLSLASLESKTVASGLLANTPPFDDPGVLTYSPDGSHLAYEAYDSRGFTHVDAVSADGGTPVAIDFIANQNLSSIVWSPDGQRLFFVSSQRTEPGSVVSVDLIERRPQFREDQFRKLFDTERTAPHGDGEAPAVPEPTPVPTATPAPALPLASPAPAVTSQPNAAPKPRAHTRIDTENIGERTRVLDTGVDAAGELAITPDGKTLVFTAVSGDESNLYSYSVDDLAQEPAVARQLTATAGAKRSLSISADGKTVYYLDGGRTYYANLDGSGSPHALPLSASFDFDFDQEKAEVFAQTWGLLDEHYADPNFNGVDWNAVRQRYAPYVAGARNQGDLARLLNLMVGELNSSHSGVAVPAATGGAPNIETALGVDFDRNAYERRGELRIKAVVPLGPAALSHEIAPGDVIEAVDGHTVESNDNLDGLLENRAGKRTVLRVSGHDVAVMPVQQTDVAPLRYRAWVASRRALVEKRSGGRLGYVHMLDMSSDALAQLYLDLDTTQQAKDGVIVDIRNNEGGFIDPYVTDVFARKNYLRFKGRGYPAGPERAGLGQRLLDKPTALLVNEHSLSDAENFTEDYRAAHLGPVIGVPTAGWIIFTSNIRLFDGTNVRIPGYQTLTLDGTNLERHPRPVDVTVERDLGEDARGNDAQLEAAVRALERRLGSPRS